MSVAKFTPGPWRTGLSADNGIPSVKAIDPKDGMRFEVCEVWGEDRDTVETPVSRANARLIAAAPDLYEAAAMAAEYMQENDPDAVVIDTLLAAMYKAYPEGENDE